MKCIYTLFVFHFFAHLSYGLSISSVNVFCKGNNTGSATISPSSSAYKYLWNTGDTTVTINNLTVGNYCCYVTTIATNQIDTFCVTITEPSLVFSLDSIMINKPCGASCNGQIIAFSASGGTSPYTHLNGVPIGNIVNNICYGNNTVTIKDAKGCIASKSIFVDSFPSNNVFVFVTGDSATRCNKPNAVITANVSGGSGNYTYNWNNGATTNVISVTQPTTYKITVLDGPNSCPRVASFRVYNGSSALLSYTSVSPASCSTLNPSGTATIHPQGGLAPISYLWGTSPVYTTASINGLSAGNYPYTITDGAGCTGTGSANVYIGNSLHTSTITSSSNCASNGTATVRVYYSGAINATSPIAYHWNTVPPQYMPTATGLSPGTYGVTVTDSTGCTATATAHVDSGLNTISGYLYIDSNANCVRDSNDSPIRHSTVYATGINATHGVYYGRTDSNGYYMINAPQGQFILKYYNSFKCMNICNVDPDTVNFTGSCASSGGHDFGLVSSSNNFDLKLQLRQSSSRPGFNKSYSIGYSRYGGQTTGVVTLHYDPRTNFVSSVPAPSLVDSVNHLLTWNVSNIPLYTFPFFISKITAQFFIPITLLDTTKLFNRFDLYPKAGDCDSTNNAINDNHPVLWSYDPNAKVCQEGNEININDSVLTYDIHFQNTGKDSTVFIVIKDTLSPFVDPGSVRDISASHPYTFSLDGEGVLTWRFDPLFLPDSATDPINSQGYVSYSVQLKPNLPVGTHIDNRASIFFDYNTPVFTNTATTTIVNTTSVHDLTADENVSVLVYPNPFAESTTFEVKGIDGPIQFELHNVLGEILTAETFTNGNKFVFTSTSLQSAVYLYNIKQNGKLIAQGKLIIE